MRHILIEHINNNELYVSNDLELGSNINGFYCMELMLLQNIFY